MLATGSATAPATSSLLGHGSLDCASTPDYFPPGGLQTLSADNRALAGPDEIRRRLADRRLADGDRDDELATLTRQRIGRGDVAAASGASANTPHQ